MKDDKDQGRTIDALDAPGVRRQRGRPPEGPPKSWAERKREQRAKAAADGKPTPVTVLLSPELQERITKYIKDAKARDGDAITKSQAIERILRNQLMRKR